MTTETLELTTDLTQYEKEVKKFETITADNLEAALVLIATFKKNAKDLDARRKAENSPHQDEIDANNKKYNPAIRFCEAAYKRIDRDVCAYREEEEHKALEAQRLEIERANKEREEAEALARIAQEEADKQRVVGNVEVAEVIEAQAQTLELEAALSFPKVVQVQPKTYALPGGGTINYRKVPTWTLPGYANDAKIPADAAIFSRVDFALIKKFFVLDPVKVNAVLKADGKLPAPFVVGSKNVSTSR